MRGVRRHWLRTEVLVVALLSTLGLVKIVLEISGGIQLLSKLSESHGRMTHLLMTFDCRLRVLMLVLNFHHTADSGAFTRLFSWPPVFFNRLICFKPCLLAQLLVDSFNLFDAVEHLKALLGIVSVCVSLPSVFVNS